MAKLVTAQLIYLPRSGVPANFPIAVGHPHNVMLPPSSVTQYNPVNCELTEAVNIVSTNAQFHLLDTSGKIIDNATFNSLLTLLSPRGKSKYQSALDRWQAAGIVSSDPGPEPLPADFTAPAVPVTPPTVTPAVSLSSLATGQIIPGPAPVTE